MSPRTTLPVAEPDLSTLEEEYLLDAFRSGWISSIGAYVDRFEREFAAFCDARHAVALANGTVALDLALAAVGVGPGDEVVVPALTFVATAAAVRHVGADPVFVDVEPGTGTMSAEAVAHAISDRTKAIIPVHVYGHPADMDAIKSVVGSRRIAIIEDAAEAHGARYKGRVVGAIGDIGTFSFYGNKIITTGEGGMLVTNDDHLAERARILKDHAMDPRRRYWHAEVGFNFRMTNLQAAIGCAQLVRFNELQAKRAALFSAYSHELAGDSHIAMLPCRDWASPAPWLVSVTIKGADKEIRDAALSELKRQGIDSRPFFELMQEMPPYVAFRRLSAQGTPDTPVARNLSRSSLNLPSATSLNASDVRTVVAALRRAVGSEFTGNALAMQPDVRR